MENRWCRTAGERAAPPGHLDPAAPAELTDEALLQELSTIVEV